MKSTKCLLVCDSTNTTKSLYKGCGTRLYWPAGVASGVVTWYMVKVWAMGVGMAVAREERTRGCALELAVLLVLPVQPAEKQYEDDARIFNELV